MLATYFKYLLFAAYPKCPSLCKYRASDGHKVGECVRRRPNWLTFVRVNETISSHGEITQTFLSSVLMEASKLSREHSSHFHRVTKSHR